MWNSRYGKEEVDTAETKEEANYLVKEYQMAYNEGSVYWRRK